MLDTLDTVPWATLEHAYGSADDVPDTLRGLISPEEKTRQEAYYTIYGNIFHQGTRYEATPYAVPFLFEMLRDPNTPDRPSLLGLLTSLALGYEEEHLPFGIDPDAYYSSLETEESKQLLERVRAYGLVYGNEDDENKAADRNVTPAELDAMYEVKLGVGMRDTYNAIEDHVPELIALLEDGDRIVRMEAAHLLAWFPRRAAESLPALRRARAVAGSLMEEANILLALGLLGRATFNLNDVIQLTALLDVNIPSSKGVAMMRTCAAIALVTLMGPEAPAEALAVLMTASEGSEEWEDEETEFPWNEDDLAGYAGIALEAAVEGHEEEIVAALCTALQSAPPMRSLALTGTLLHIVFPEGKFEGKNAADLNPLQRQALEAIAAHGGWKIDNLDFGNYSLLMSGYGLPSSQGKMQEFLGKFSAME